MKKLIILLLIPSTVFAISPENAQKQMLFGQKLLSKAYNSLNIYEASQTLSDGTNVNFKDLDAQTQANIEADVESQIANIKQKCFQFNGDIVFDPNTLPD